MNASCVCGRHPITEAAYVLKRRIKRNERPRHRHWQQTQRTHDTAHIRTRQHTKLAQHAHRTRHDTCPSCLQMPLEVSSPLSASQRLARASGWPRQKKTAALYTCARAAQQTSRHVPQAAAGKRTQRAQRRRQSTAGQGPLKSRQIDPHPFPVALGPAACPNRPPPSRGRSRIGWCRRRPPFRAQRAPPPPS